MAREKRNKKNRDLILYSTGERGAQLSFWVGGGLWEWGFILLCVRRCPTTDRKYTLVWISNNNRMVLHGMYRMGSSHASRAASTDRRGRGVCFLPASLLLLSEYGALLLVEIKRRQEKGKLTISSTFFYF